MGAHGLVIPVAAAVAEMRDDVADWAADGLAPEAWAVCVEAALPGSLAADRYQRYRLLIESWSAEDIALAIGLPVDWARLQREAVADEGAAIWWHRNRLESLTVQDVARMVAKGGGVECPVCDGSGVDMDHTGDAWDSTGRYVGQWTASRCSRCTGKGLLALIGAEDDDDEA